MLPIVLASSSKYRREVLEKLGLRFEAHSPEVDESAFENERPRELTKRLAEAKAQALAERFPSALIIGSDQVALIGDEILTKPHTHKRAFEQLRKCSGKSVEFSTGLCLLNSRTGRRQVSVDRFMVHFKDLNDEQINGYLYKEEPYDCAGSFKCEGLGIALFKALEGRDHNSLIGLPLISLMDMLSSEGLDPLI